VACPLRRLGATAAATYPVANVRPLRPHDLARPTGWLDAVPALWRRAGVKQALATGAALCHGRCTL